MATGISAAPILLVMFHPKIEDVIADYVNISPPTDGFLIIAPKARAFKRQIGLLITEANGIFMAYPLYKLANFLKAARDPLKVTPPINTPKNEAIVCRISG